MKTVIKVIKNNICGFIIGVVLCLATIGIYAESTLTLAEDVSYDNRKSGSAYDDVQKALEDLYSKAESLSSITCPLGMICLPGATKVVVEDVEPVGQLSVGDRIQYTLNTNYNNGETYTEYFRVAGFNDDGTEVKLLPEHNLLLPTAEAPYPHQDPADAINASVFSSSQYWNSSATANSYVYSSSSTLYTYVEKYRELLESAGVPIKPDNNTSTAVNRSVRLLTYDEADAIRSQSWSHSKSYWTGATKGGSSSDNVWYVYSNGNFYGETYNNTSYHGVRPIIIINVSDF